MSRCAGAPPAGDAGAQNGNNDCPAVAVVSGSTVLGQAKEASGDAADNQQGEAAFIDVLTSPQKLIAQFGCSELGSAMIARIEQLTRRPAHVFLRCGYGEHALHKHKVSHHSVCDVSLFFSHRDLEVLLDDVEAGRPFYIYTGRGPSAGSLHLGHLVPFLFTRYLQEAFGAPVVIQITDDEKFLHKHLTLEQCDQYTIDNVKDIVALGFDPARTLIFQNTRYIRRLYPTVLAIQRLVTNNQVRATFGIKMSDNIGKTAFPAVQAAPCFPATFPHLFGKDKSPRRCLVPQGIDQDPYFRLTRDVAPKMGAHKPSLIHGKFLPSLLGVHAKMSASDPSSAIFMSDTADEIRTKIIQSFSGGQGTLKLHREKGANLDVDVGIHYLRALLEDDTEFDAICAEYKAGRMMTSQVKERLIQVVQRLVEQHKKARAAITPELLARFMPEQSPGVVA